MHSDDRLAGVHRKCSVDDHKAERCACGVSCVTTTAFNVIARRQGFTYEIHWSVDGTAPSQD